MHRMFLPSAGRKVAAPSGPNRSSSAPVHLAAEQPVREAAAGLLLDHERQAVAVAAEIDHGIGAPALEARHLQHDELACVECDRLRQSNVDLDDVAHEPADALDAAAPVAGQRRAAWVGDEVGRHAQDAVRRRARLAHEHVALGAFQPREPRRLIPLDQRGPLHDAAAAGAACAGGAFVGQPQPLAEAGVEQPLGGVALEAEFSGIGLDGDFHVR